MKFEKVFPEPGANIVLLDGWKSGSIAEVTRPNFSLDTFLVHFEGDRVDSEYMVSTQKDHYVELDSFRVPDWMLCLSIEDNLLVHNSIPDYPQYLTGDLRSGGTYGVLFKIIDAVWYNRLPVSEDEVWEFVRMHGAPENLREEFIQYLSFGRKFAETIGGRRAVKRRRMKAMSQGRYLTKGQLSAAKQTGLIG